MKRDEGMKYRSRWDWSTWLIIVITIGCCMGNWFVDPSIWPFLISAAMLVFIVMVFLSVWYRIDGDRLIVHQGFWSKDYPIDKIKEIKRVHLYQSAPATSVVHRIGISFTDRSILKSSTPLIISPSRLPDFIEEIKRVNPGVIVDEDLTVNA